VNRTGYLKALLLPKSTKKLSGRSEVIFHSVGSLKRKAASFYAYALCGLENCFFFDGNSVSEKTLKDNVSLTR